MLRAALAGLGHVNRLLERVIYALAALIVAVMVLALAFSALTRFVSGTGYDWFIELPPVLSCWLVFPLLGPLLKAGQHIKVVILPVFLSIRQRGVLSLFIHITALASAFVFLRAGLDATQLCMMLGQMVELEIEIPIWWMYLAFPTGFAVLALFAAEMALRDVQQLINGGEE